MSESNTCRNMVLGVFFLCVLLGLVSGGPRLSERSPQHQQTPQAEWGQRIHYPVIDSGQRIQFPSPWNSQRVQYPSVGHQQRCDAGYYLDRSGPVDQCVPCSCNNLSNECEENTGRCLNCQYNTAGDHCERCKEGYYTSATHRTCRLCPCPLSTEANNFAMGCTETNGRFHCFCKVGYVGERCERCAPGFYGDPQVHGGHCRPCNCSGNACDSVTGVCRSFLELRDTSTEEQCKECDSCAQTLLNDLEKLDINLRVIKDQLDVDNLRPSSKEHLRKLEEATAATMSLVNTYSFTINNQRPKITQLEQDVFNLVDDVDDLKEQARRRLEDSQKALANIENDRERTKDLDTETQNLHKKIQDFLKQLVDGSSNEAALPSADLTKLLQESEHMVKEMEKRNFRPQKEAAQNNQDEAKKFLEQVSNITRQSDENEDASKRVESLLNSYATKLKELEDSLKQAVNMVKNASSQNDLNAEGLKDILKQINDLERERNLVLDQIALAEDQLKDTEASLKTFNDSKTEYGQLAKELDNAKNNLKKKVQDSQAAAAKENVVKQAEEHAKNLHNLAKELQEAVQNVSGRSGVQNALSGIDAYKNITSVISAAEEAAEKAKQAADKALSDVSEGDLIKRAKTLKDEGNNLLKNAKNAARDLKGINKDLSNQMERLQDTEKKTKQLEEQLMAVKDGLKDIKRDDIGHIIDAAKKAAASANYTTSDTVNQLNDIKAEVAKMSVSPSVSNIDNVLTDVDMTVKNLSGSFPSLLDKIDQLNSQLSAGNNVSDNINRIKELIEQAREAANRIVVPMKFIGTGHVELRPPKDIDDLRAYTALTLSLQRPEKPNRGGGRRRRRQIQVDQDNLFVLYLGNKDASGDYFGIALQNNILNVIYKLNGEEYKIKTSDITESPDEPAFFDKIDIHRIYQDAEVIHTQEFTSSNPKPQQVKGNLGELARNLLDLSPNDVVFYVGGYPDDFKPPASLNYGKYKGCIEFSTFNEKFISLYNFKDAVNINLDTPCKRHIPVKSLESDFYEGSGYAKVMLEKFPSITAINQKVETRSKDALLLFLGDENDDFFYSISLERGYLVLRGQDKNTVLKTVRSVEKPSLYNETDVRIIINLSKEIKVIVNQVEIKAIDFSPRKFKHYYIGGIPKVLSERYNITVPALKGCVKIGSAGGISPYIKEEVGIGRGCSQELLVVRKADFSLGSALEKDRDDFSLAGDVNLSLGFRSTKSDGLLLQNGKDNNHIDISMEKGQVVLKLQGNIWKSNKQYQDGNWHYLTVIRQGQSVELRIDEDDVGKRLTDTSSELYSSNILLGKDTFRGCISNLYLRRQESPYRPEDLSAYSATGNVLMSSCSAGQSI